MRDREIVIWFFGPWLTLMLVLLPMWAVVEVWRYFGDWGVLMFWAWAEAELFILGRHILRRLGR